MVISGYGVKLVRIKHEHIELVRRYRNSERIRLFMEYREEITPEMQEEWFQKINNRNHGYFLIEVESNFIGLINGRDIDWEKKETKSGGIFIWDESWWNTTVPVAASLLFTEVSFLLGLERTYIRVLRSNKNAIAYNKRFGYQLLPNQDEVENQEYILTKEAFFLHTKKMRELFTRRWGNSFTCIITDPNEDAALNALEIAAHFTPEERTKFSVIVAA